MTMLGYLLGSVFPPITKQIDKVIIVIIAVSLIPGAISWLAEPQQEARDACRWPPERGEFEGDSKADARDQSARPARRAAPRIAFPKKNAPPTEAEFIARLPLASGRRLEMLRAFLKKQKGVAEDLYFFGPKTGWAYRYLRDAQQSVGSILIHDEQLLGVVALDPAATAAVDWNALSPVGAEGQAPGARQPGAAVDRPAARRPGRRRLQGGGQGQARRAAARAAARPHLRPAGIAAPGE